MPKVQFYFWARLDLEVHTGTGRNNSWAELEEFSDMFKNYILKGQQLSGNGWVQIGTQINRFKWVMVKYWSWEKRQKHVFKGGVGGIGINIPELRKQDIAQFFAPKKNLDWIA